MNECMYTGCLDALHTHPKFHLHRWMYFHTYDAYEHI